MRINPGFPVLALATAVGLSTFAMAGQAQAFTGCVYFTSTEKLDKSFNEMAFVGARDAGVAFKEILPESETAYEALLRENAPNCDLNVTIGFRYADPLGKVAAEFPDSRFVIVDSVVQAANVRSVVFAEHEGSYLAGVAAGLASRSGTVGFVGGVDAPLIRKFLGGFAAGAQSVNPNITVLVEYVGSFADAFAGGEIASEMIADGADVLFAAAGGSGLGVLDAAQAEGALAIGVDSNQNFLYPGKILTSMMKRVDVAVMQAMKDAAAGQFSGGVVTLDLKAGGVDVAVDEFNAPVWTPAIEDAVKAARDRVISGEVSVPQDLAL